MAYLKAYIGTVGTQVHTAIVVSAVIVRVSATVYYALYVISDSLYCRKSTDGGSEWGSPVTVVTESYTGSSGIEFDAAADSSGNIHVVYRVRTNGTTTNTIYHTIRDVSTENWSIKEDIYSGGTGYYKSPKIAIDSSDDVHCVYHKGTLGSASVNYVKRTSGTWGSEVSLATKYSKDLSSQDICIDSNDYIHVVYAGATTARNLHYRLYNGSWQAEETLAGFSDATNWQIEPSIAVDSSDIVHVAWSGLNYGDNNPTRYQVCYVTGNTGSWSSVSALTDESNSQGNSYGLAVAVNGLDEIDVFWTGRGFSGTKTTSNHIQYTDGAWGDVEVISDYSIASTHGAAWAAHPSSAKMPSSFIVLARGITNLIRSQAHIIG